MFQKIGKIILKNVGYGLLERVEMDKFMEHLQLNLKHIINHSDLTDLCMKIVMDQFQMEY